ncbi:MAG: DUF5989 family protein [Elusimicrobiota bacterium]
MTEKKHKPLGHRLKENLEVLKEIYALIKLHKRWALLPVFLVLAVLSLFITLAGGSSVLPAIYALF